MPQVNEYSWTVLSLNFIFLAFLVILSLSFMYVVEMPFKSVSKMFMYTFILVV